MRYLKIVCTALIVALIAFCFLLGLCAIIIEICSGDTLLFAGEQQEQVRKCAPVNNEVQAASPAPCVSLAKNLDDVHAASCRVVCSRPGSRTGSIGTGTVVLAAEGKYWVLTNWHVVNGFNQFKLQFFRDGKILEVAATLEKSWHNEKSPWDFAVLTVPEEKLKKYNPPIVPLAGPDVKPLTDRPILSSGCSEGRWSLAWKGSIESYYGNTAHFYPAPKSGQSGSAIVQEIDGSLRVTGILTWRVGDERTVGEEQMRGGAIPICNFFDAASGRQRTNNGESIPPNAAWCTDTTPKKIDPAIPGGNAPIKVWPVQSATEYFNAPAASYSGLELFVFVGPGCKACEQVKPVIAKLIKEGYKITTIDAATPDGKKECAECKVTVYPTFILCRDAGSKYDGLERWAGSDSAEPRIRFVFAKHARRGLPDAPKVTATEKLGPSPEEVARQKRKDRKINPPAESTQPDSPTTGGATGGNTSGSGSGDVSPLLNQYGSGSEKKQSPNPSTGLRRQQPDANAGSDSGLIGGVTDKLADRLQSQIDKLTADVQSKIDASVDDLKQEATEKINTWLAKVFWTAVVLIVVVWYVIWWLFTGIRYTIKRLPTITIERRKAEE